MTLEEMLARVRGHQMDIWEKRAQSISWVAGQFMCDRPDADEWQLRLDAAKAWEKNK